MEKMFGNIRSDEILDLLNEQDRAAINSVINGEAGTGGEGLSVADKTKLDNITATGPVNLDELKEKVNSNTKGIYATGEEPTDAEAGDFIIVIDSMPGQNDEDEYYFTGFKAFDGNNWIDVIDPIKDQVEENTAKLDNITVTGPINLDNLTSNGGNDNFVGYYETGTAPIEEMDEGDYVGYIDGTTGNIIGYAKKEGGNLTDVAMDGSMSTEDKDKLDNIEITQSVNLDTLESDTATALSNANNAKGKTDYITVTQPVNIDSIEADVANAKGKTDYITVTQAVNLDSVNEPKYPKLLRWTDSLHGDGGTDVFYMYHGISNITADDIDKGKYRIDILNTSGDTKIWDMGVNMKLGSASPRVASFTSDKIYYNNSGYSSLRIYLYQIHA